MSFKGSSKDLGIFKLTSTLCKALYFAIPIVILAVDFLTLFSLSIWVDEAYSLALSSHSFIDIIKIDSIDVHPPLYYLIQHGAYLIYDFFGLSFEWYVYLSKIMAFVPYVVLCIISFTYLRKKYGWQASFAFNCLLLGLPHMLEYSSEIRMYSWGMLFVFVAFLYALRIVEQEKAGLMDYIWLCVFAALSAYTHYFACGSAILIYVYLILCCLLGRSFAKLKYIVLSGVGVVVLYLPWLFVFIGQASVVKADYWISEIDLPAVFMSILFLIYTDSDVKNLILAVVVVAILSSLILIFAKKKSEAFGALFICIGTIGMGLFISKVFRPVYIPRYVLSSAACFCLGIALAFSQWNKKIISEISVVAACLIAVMLLPGYYSSENEYSVKANQAFEAVSEVVGEDTVLFFDYGQVQRTVMLDYPENRSIVKPMHDTDYKEVTSEPTKQVYSNLKLENVQAVDEIAPKDLSNMVLICFLESTPELFEAEGVQLESLGNYCIRSYEFGLYRVL